ncbi:MAG: response regulator transcription factor [Clostridia bacterium]|nr:response regulator transcription factor [Clostridia bacterium]
MAKILIVEDEQAINDLICLNLRLVGHQCHQCFDGKEALSLLEGERFDLVILDVMLPGASGFEIVEEIKDTPVIFVTAKGTLEDRLKGLRAGGDDYIVKPFEILELVARVEAVLRRKNRQERVLEFDDLKVDFGSKQVFKGGEEIALKPKEYALLETLLKNRNIALSREKLINLVWEFDYEGDTRTVDVHIQHLRGKLGLQERIKTVYKLGYRFEL